MNRLILLIFVLMVVAASPISVLGAPGPVNTQILNSTDIKTANYSNVTGEIRILGVDANLVSEDQPDGQKSKLTVLSDSQNIQPAKVEAAKNGSIITSTPRNALTTNQTNPNKPAPGTGGSSSRSVNNILLLLCLICVGLRAAFEKNML